MSENSSELDVESRLAIRRAYLDLHKEFSIRYAIHWCATDEVSRREHMSVWVTELIKNNITGEEISRAKSIAVQDERYERFPPKIGEFIRLCKSETKADQPNGAPPHVLDFHRSLLARYRRRWCDASAQAEATLLGELANDLERNGIQKEQLVRCQELICTSGAYIDTPPSIMDIIELCHGNENLDFETIAAIVAGGSRVVKLTASERSAIAYARKTIGGLDVRVKHDHTMKRTIYKYYRQGLIESRKLPQPEEVASLPESVEMPAQREKVHNAIDDILKGLI